MKPILSRKVTREQQSVGDWIPAREHNTVQGVAEFWRRQQERMAAAQANRAEAQEKMASLPVKRRTT